MEIESILALEMSQAVYDAVYDAYEPEVYQRRESHGGLSDIRNMEITNITLEGNSLRLVFENLTPGADSYSHTFVGELIEYGEGYKGMRWQNPYGEWAEPRPFSALATERLRNGGDLVNALKRGFKELGIKTD